MLDRGEAGWRLLTVGEAGFAFSAQLSSSQCGDGASLVATCYETEEVALERFPDCAEHVKILRAAGASVYFGVDATAIPSSLGTFDEIIFNFPHIDGKMRLDRNRVLLRGFFSSAVASLSGDVKSRVHVALCRGQGGTPWDTRPERESWRIVACAAGVDLVLCELRKFEDSYPATGYRKQQKGFNRVGALVHSFRRCSLATMGNLFNDHPTVPLSSASNVSLWQAPSDEYLSLVARKCEGILRERLALDDDAVFNRPRQSAISPHVICFTPLPSSTELQEFSPGQFEHHLSLGSPVFMTATQLQLIAAALFSPIFQTHCLLLEVTPFGRLYSISYRAPGVPLTWERCRDCLHESLRRLLVLLKFSVH